MNAPFLPTVVVRHKKENLKKCSLKGLEGREDFLFMRYPLPQELLLPTENYVILAIDAPPLTKEDAQQGLLLIDATWRYAKVMSAQVDAKVSLQKRSIPGGFLTAYPRYQDDCPDPKAGLASIEALYIAYRILGRDTAGLLDRYYWKEYFLKRNLPLFCQ